MEYAVFVENKCTSMEYAVFVESRCKLALIEKE